MTVDIALGRPPLPKEHGGWAMLLTPPVVALLAVGPSSLGLLAVTGWIVAYCLRGPVEALLGMAPTGKAGLQHANPAVSRLWLLLFGLLSVGLLAAPVRLFPRTALWLLGAAVTGSAVVGLASIGKTRSITAGLLGAAALMPGGPLYYEAAFGRVGAEGWTLALASFAFFAGSIFRVKTLARERRSAWFRWVSVLLHALAVGVAVWAAAAGMASWLVVLALAPALGWAAWGAIRAGEAVSLAVIGKGEQWLTILFGLLLAAALRLG